MSHSQKESLKPGKYHVHIDSELKKGVMNYGEVIIPGQSEKEILLSTYICHPSMANNELSGPAVTTALANWLSKQKDLKYTYRIVYVPETIGAITYISNHLDHLKENVIAGYQITCVGDERNYSFLSSRYGGTLADRVAKHVLNYAVDEYDEYSFLERGSDERQYCSPGVDLPVASVMRTKYGEYPEYHTSLDNLELVSQEGLMGAYNVYQKILQAFENNCVPRVSVYCEPQLGKRGLYPDISKKGSAKDVRLMTNLIAYSDGTNDTVDIAEILDKPIWEIIEVIKELKNSIIDI
jgi:aminopeptidase-like protein